MFQTIQWTGQAVRLLDQTKLPTQAVYVDITDEKQMHDAIKRLVVRGAPAIGVAAAFGVYLGIRDAPDHAVHQRVIEVCDYLATSRPTAVNLFWALERMRSVLRAREGEAPAEPGITRVPGSARASSSHSIEKQRILDECLAIVEEDRRACRAIGEHGLQLLRSIVPDRASDQPINLLTHCNAGALVAVEYGTALAPVYVGAEQGVRFHVYADETRPLLQGSRITAFELSQLGIPVTVICDNMSASVMSAGNIDAVVVGADRIAANGDVANKIGTLGVAILAKHFGIPFLVAAPTSTIDRTIATGAQIPIEQRAAREVVEPFGVRIAPLGVDVLNPAFDVTPAALVSAIVTERGVVSPPYVESIATALSEQQLRE